jgi:sec-independent protein translocase protein TatA
VFNLGMSEIVVILVVALVFLGPKKLPELASGIGKMIRELRKATADIKSEIELDETIRKPVEELREAMTLHPEELKRRDLERALREREERERLEREKAEQAAQAEQEAQAAKDAGEAKTVAAPAADALNGDKTIAMASPPVLTPPEPRPATPPIAVPRVPGSVPRSTLIGVPPASPARPAVPPPTPAASKLPPPPSGIRPAPPAPAPTKKA